MKKSFWQLLKDPKFSLAFAFALIIIGWDLAYGSKVLGYIFSFLLAVVIALNLWKNR